MNVACRKKMKGPWTIEVNQFMLLGVSLCAHSTWKMTRQTITIIQSGQIKWKKSKHAEQMIHVFLVLSWAHNAEGCLGSALTPCWPHHTKNQDFVCGQIDTVNSKKLSFGGSNWFEKTNMRELHVVLSAIFLSVVRNLIGWKSSDFYCISGLEGDFCCCLKVGDDG